jgi:hypothetical protein
MARRLCLQPAPCSPKGGPESTSLEEAVADSVADGEPEMEAPVLSDAVALLVAVRVAVSVPVAVLLAVLEPVPVPEPDAVLLAVPDSDDVCKSRVRRAWCGLPKSTVPQTDTNQSVEASHRSACKSGKASHNIGTPVDRPLRTHRRAARSLRGRRGRRER